MEDDAEVGELQRMLDEQAAAEAKMKEDLETRRGPRSASPFRGVAKCGQSVLSGANKRALLRVERSTF